MYFNSLLDFNGMIFRILRRLIIELITASSIISDKTLDYKAMLTGENDFRIDIL